MKVKYGSKGVGKIIDTNQIRLILIKTIEIYIKLIRKIKMKCSAHAARTSIVALKPDINEFKEIYVN